MFTSSNNKTTDDMVCFFKDTIKNPVFFFCGSGISLASNLPNVENILLATFGVFFPKSIIVDNEKISINKEVKRIANKIQPEVFYEILLRLTGNNFNSLNIWKCLVENNSKPNLAHLFIVQYSYYNNSPIITTNFDLMFEKAAEHLGIDYIVLLPHDNPLEIKKDKLYICKIHGTIADNKGFFTPESLFTTMTDITKKNIKWILYLQKLMDQKHICFVGYSGRDFDFYPFLEKKAQLSKKQVVWIDNFDENSNKRSFSCNALRLKQYPFNHHDNSGFIVEYIKKDKNYENIIYDKPILNEDVNATIERLKKELSNINLLSNDDARKLFYSCILQSLGEYNKAYEVAVGVYEKNKNQLLGYQKNILLLTLYQLNHEKSKYSTCGKLAKELITSKFSSKNDIFMGKLLLCESLRMSIPNGIYFPQKYTLYDYFFLIRVLTQFFVVSIQISFLKLTNSYHKLNIKTKHEAIEHNIRFFAIIQGILISRKKSNKKYWYLTSIKYLYKTWLHLRDSSYQVGYSMGIANTQKFIDRITPDDEFNIEAQEIFGLITSSTGQELLLRNKADKALEDLKYEEAKKLYLKYAKQARISGNVLNEVKGYIGNAYVNYKQHYTPSLNKEELERLRFMHKEVEGKQWKKHLGEVINFINNGQSNE